MRCELNKKAGGRWLTVSKRATYHEAEQFALDNREGIFIVKMMGKDDNEVGYFTNGKEEYRHYQSKGLNCYEVRFN